MAGRARTWLTVCAVALAAAAAPAPREAKADPMPATRAVPVRAVAPSSAVSPSELAQDYLSTPAEYSTWKGLSAGCSYMTPKDPFVAADGGVDVVFHFHAGQMSERQMKESGANAVFVSCGFGMGTEPYANRFAHPSSFGFMVDRLLKNLEADTQRRGVHLRHVALASWSAGFAAVGKILGVARWYDAVDSVVLLDSLHARYKGSGKHVAAMGAQNVDVASMGVWVKLANDAAHGKKTLVITHSAIVPPDYASSSEATTALLTAIGVPTTSANEDRTNAKGRTMTLGTRADAGNLHVRGYRGRGPTDHFDHLYLIGEALRSWVVPRWKREERLVYTLNGEQR
jgi:hypothetical protein